MKIPEAFSVDLLGSSEEFCHTLVSAHTGTHILDNCQHHIIYTTGNALAHKIHLSTHNVTFYSVVGYMRTLTQYNSENLTHTRKLSPQSSITIMLFILLVSS
jgi:hypothetical protein